MTPRAAVVQLALLAAGVSATKVVLFTSGTTLLLARAGAEAMPGFYVALAGLAVAASAALATVVDRVPATRLVRGALAATIVGALALHAALRGGLPVPHGAALAAAHLFEIATDILFWLAAGLYLTSYELRRATPWLLAATAGGGLLGGVAAGALAGWLAPEDLLLAVPPLAGLTLAQAWLAEARLRPVPGSGGDADGEEEEGALSGLRAVPELLGRHPLAVLVALSSFMLTLVYSISEYLCFAAYAAAFPDDAELARFLGVMFGVLQASELGLLVLLGRPLMERLGPLARNLAFPACALASLCLFAVGDRLLAAVLTHITTESVSNALYEPASTGNYAALPRRIHGRVRALANGVLYPLGLAAGGGLLAVAELAGGPGAALALGLAGAVLFLALSAAIGRLFLPALVRQLRSGVEHYAGLDAGFRLDAACARARVRDLARSRDPEAHRLALEVAARLDPAAAAELVGPVVGSGDPALCEALGDALGRLPDGCLRPVAARLAAGPGPVEQLLASRLLLARPDLRRRSLARRIAGSPCPAAAFLGGLILRADRRPDPALAEAARQALAEALPAERRLAAVALAASGTRHASLLAELADLLDPDTLRATLRAVAAAAPPAGAATPAAPFVAACLTHADPLVRLAALGSGRAAGGVAAEALGALLEDADPAVRAAPAAAFAGRGGTAVAAAAERLAHPRRAVRHAAIAALGVVGAPEARSRLERALAPHRAFARQAAAWLGPLDSPARPAAFDDLAAAVESRCAEAVDAGLAIAAALGGGRVVGDLRARLSADDPRRRADALEALASLRERRAIRPLLPILERQIRAGEAGRQDGQDGAAPPPPARVWRAIASAASESDDPWVRRAAARAAAATAAASPDGGTVDRVLALSRIGLFRLLPLDTLARVDRLAEERAHAAGETVTEPETGGRGLFVLLRGSVLLERPGQVPRVARAPALFGEGSAVDDRVPPPRATAREDCVVLRICAVVFHDLARDHPEIWVEVCRALARQLDGGPGAAAPAAAPAPEAELAGAGATAVA